MIIAAMGTLNLFHPSFLIPEAWEANAGEYDSTVSMEQLGSGQARV